MTRGGVVRLALFLASSRPAQLASQISISLSAGARWTSTLVHDSIVTPLDLGIGIGPAFSLVVGTQPEHGWGTQLLIDVSSGDMARHDADGTSTTLQHVTTISLAVGVTHALPGGLRGSASVGGVKYLPSEDTGIFRDGGGAIAPLGAVSLAYPLPLGSTPRRFWLEARYDIHGFATQALKDEGFTSSQIVHRVALALRADFQVAK